jgi:WD40 repeat protein
MPKILKKPTPAARTKRPAQSARKKRPPKPARKKPLIPAQAALLGTLKHADFVQFTPNGQLLLVGRRDSKTITLWDVTSRDEMPPLKAPAAMTALALSADSRYLAMGTSKGTLAVESTQAAKVAWKTKDPDAGPIGEVLFSLDGSLVIAAPAFRDEGDAWIRVHKTATGEIVSGAGGFEPVAGALCCHLAVSPDGVFLAHSEERSHSVLVWHLPTRQMGACLRLPPRDGRIVRLAFGHTVRQLYVAQEKRVSGWNGENGTEFVQIATEGVQSLAVIDGGASLATLRVSAVVGSDEPTAGLNFWNAESGRLRHTVPLPVQAYGHLASPPDGSLLALPGEKECWVWRVAKLVT